MKKVAVFGKPGSGKSTLSKKLASETGIALYQLDSMLYQKNGEQVSHESFEARHDEILASESWILDGMGLLGSFNKRLEAADTLVYVELPYSTSYWLVTKRLLKGLFIKPEGWPDGSSVLKGSVQSYKFLKLSPKFWNDKFLKRLEAMSENKNVYVIRSVKELNEFVRVNVELEKRTLGKKSI
ncbi:Shikimate kinase [Grimontia celer]|uniref:Shikimate kinase n=1 Tax=Grimontia celer TaxID=1796497 RepID=A0A128EW66_9GAMM|nr:adenylate kinase [Grimontia celer]CZF78440.1 Shikimate kinase [Grimontia celer]